MARTGHRRRVVDAFRDHPPERKGGDRRPKKGWGGGKIDLSRDPIQRKLDYVCETRQVNWLLKPSIRRIGANFHNKRGAFGKAINNRTNKSSQPRMRSKKGGGKYRTNAPVRTKNV